MPNNEPKNCLDCKHCGHYKFDEYESWYSCMLREDGNSITVEINEDIICEKFEEE